MSSPGLSIERFAFVIAHLEHFSEVAPDRVLSALGHTRQDLTDASRTVPSQLATEAAKGSRETAERFVKTHETTAADLRARCPSLEQLDAEPKQIPTAAATAAIAIEDEATVMHESEAPPPAGVPFRRPTPGEPPPFLPFAKPDPKEQSGETLGLTNRFVAAPGTPFEASRLAAWTVEAYANFVADRRSAPPEVVTKIHGAVSEQEEVALLLHFNKRFRQEPGLHECWERLVAERLRLNRGTRWSS